MTRVSHAIDRFDVSFDDPNLVANAGLLLTATLSDRLDLEALIDTTVKLRGRVGGAHPGRKVLTLTHAMIAGGTHMKSDQLPLHVFQHTWRINPLGNALGNAEEDHGSLCAIE